MCSFIFVFNCLDGKITQHTQKSLILIKSLFLALDFGSCFTYNVYTRQTTQSFKCKQNIQNVLLAFM